VSYILDGGPCQVGLESTIVSLTESGEVVVLRKGGISVEQLEEVVGGVHVQTHSSSTPAAPGMLTSHYAPKIPLVLGIEPTALQQYLPERIGIISFSQPIDGIPKENQVVLSHTGNMEEAARNLFSGMRYLDGCPLDIIFAEEVPPHHLGLAINDRLHRAAADRTTPHA
jgi:L-threonylcarbamoyladenylate synthase